MALHGALGSLPTPQPHEHRGPDSRLDFRLPPVEPGDTAGGLLRRIAASQKSDSEHCHVPWDSVIDDLGPERGSLVHDNAARQVVTWDPSTQRRAQAKLQQQKRFLKLQSRSAFFDFGLFWNLDLRARRGLRLLLCMMMCT
jgi:hypothetical protein